MSKQISRRDALRQRRARTVWPLLLAAAGALLVGAAALAAWRGASEPRAAIEVTGAPSLKVDRETVDLGDVRLGQTVEASFEISNVGDRQLRFTAVPYIEVVEGC